MISYPVKKNLIGSAVSEILRYKQTHRQTSCYLLYIKPGECGPFLLSFSLRDSWRLVHGSKDGAKQIHLVSGQISEI